MTTEISRKLTSAEIGILMKGLDLKGFRFGQHEQETRNLFEQMELVEPLDGQGKNPSESGLGPFYELSEKGREYVNNIMKYANSFYTIQNQ